MTYNPEIHKRKSIRLKGYDYSQGGLYFVTICTQNHECIFGEILDEGRGTIFCALNKGGKIAEKCLIEIPKHYPKAIVDCFIVMPNHIHMILIIENNDRTQNIVPLQEQKFQKIISGSISAIIRGYKIGVTKWFRKNTDIYDVWQRNYHEHIIRNEKSLEKIRNYIENNPEKWEEDKFFKI